MLGTVLIVFEISRFKWEQFLMFDFIAYFRGNSSNLEKFQLHISRKELYGENDTLVAAVIEDMLKLPIQHVGEYEIISIEIKLRTVCTNRINFWCKSSN